MRSRAAIVYRLLPILKGVKHGLWRYGWSTVENYNVGSGPCSITGLLKSDLN